MIFFRHQLAVLPAVDSELLALGLTADGQEEQLLGLVGPDGAATPCGAAGPSAGAAQGGTAGAAAGGAAAAGPAAMAAAAAVGNSYVDSLGKAGIKEVRGRHAAAGTRAPLPLLLPLPVRAPRPHTQALQPPNRQNQLRNARSQRSAMHPRCPAQVRDAVFLHGYNEPVLALLHEGDPTWAGNLRQKVRRWGLEREAAGWRLAAAASRGYTQLHYGRTLSAVDCTQSMRLSAGLEGEWAQAAVAGNQGCTEWH